MLACNNGIESTSQEFHDFYGKETLRHWHGKYSNNIKLLFQEELAPYLPSGLHVEIETPYLPSEGINAFNFYCRDNRIVIPISALLFMDQIMTAFAWLDYNNYTSETIFDYLGMLKYGKTHDYPLPWPPLGIPENVYENQHVNAWSLELSKTALLWIMAHEAGHIFHNHSVSTIANEIQADQYANSMFRKMGYAPKGIPYFFSFYTNIMLHRGDFSTEEAWLEYASHVKTHPCTGDRLILLGNDLKRNPEDFTRYASGDKATIIGLNKVSDMIIDLGKRLNDPEIQNYLTFRSVMVKTDYLKPHAADNYNWLPGARPSAGNRALLYSGNYEGVFMHFTENDRKEYFRIKLHIQRNGSSVTGNYNFGMGIGNFIGTITPNQEAVINWNHGTAKGSGIIKVSNSDKYNLEANWGYNASADNGGTWKLVKK